MVDKAYQEDVTFLKAALPELQAYMLSKETFWPVCCASATTVDMSKLTFGNLALVTRRLQAWPEKTEHLAYLDELQAFKERWRANVDEKMTTEYGVRMRLWQSYISDVVNSEDRHRTEFAYKVRWRTILTLIEEEVGTLEPAEVSLVAQLDKSLSALTHTADFIWGDVYQPVFPNEPFWYLYRELKGAR